jgi:stringent starvation protein B
MTSTRPYLIRAMHEWIIDNGMTPHLLVDTSDDQVMVPRQYEQDGKIVLNIGPTATQDLELGNEAVSFHARFDGEAMSVFIPCEKVLAIYTRENGQGMMFGDDSEMSPPPDPDNPSPDKPPHKGPHLKVVK